MDITIVKQSEGQNILLSKVDAIVEKIELEIEFINRPNLSPDDRKTTLIDMIDLMRKFNQFYNDGFIVIEKLLKNTRKNLQKNLKNYLQNIKEESPSHQRLSVVFKNHKIN